jgi:glycosyltransferase involved in cell wall biosynthesis
MVGVEAAAHGVPTLLSSVVPVSDLLGESCIVFEADDEPALHDALERLIVDDSAYQKLLPLVRARRDIFYDKSQSWGSQLGRVLLSL